VTDICGAETWVTLAVGTARFGAGAGGFAVAYAGALTVARAVSELLAPAPDFASDGDEYGGRPTRHEAKAPPPSTEMLTLPAL
jgi:hypothetical protein